MGKCKKDDIEYNIVLEKLSYHHTLSVYIYIYTHFPLGAAPFYITLFAPFCTPNTHSVGVCVQMCVCECVCVCDCVCAPLFRMPLFLSIYITKGGMRLEDC